ncbi:reverse transcriptase domain-containing protein [Tanacetum coccineum]
MHQEKLKAVKARLNFEEVSQHSESGTPSRRKDLRKRLGYKHVCSISGCPEPRRGQFESPRKKGPERKTVFKRLDKCVFHRLGDKEKGMSAYSNDSRRRSYYSSRRDTESCYQSSRSRGAESAPKKNNSKRGFSRRTEALSEGEDSAGGHWKSRSKRQESSVEEDDLSQPHECPVTSRHMTKIIQAAAKMKRWAMPTWCHMFNSTRTGYARVWFDDLPKESIDSYNDLKKAFLENYLQQKKCIKYPVKIHNIKHRDGESTEEFVRRYKLKYRDVKGAPKCMKISGFMHGITNPELIKRLPDKIPKSVDEMMRQEAGQKQNFKKGSFRNQQRLERKQDRFTLLTKTPKEILALDKGKFKPPPPMTTPIEKRNASKFCEFHGEVGHTTDECMHLKRQIEEMLKAGKLSHLIKELKQNNRKDQAKATKKGETSEKDKPLAILVEDGTEGPMIIEAEMGGHFVHRMYVDRGSLSEILYEHCFNRFRPEVRIQMIPAAAPLVRFSREIIWPLGQISLLVKIGDEEHLTLAWMNFMVVRSPSPYNEIIGRLGVRRIQTVSSTAYGKLKFLVTSGTVTLRSSRIIPLECTMVSGPGAQQPVINQVTEEKIQVAIHPEYPEQTIAIGSTLTEEGRKELCGLLRRNLDIFA